MHTSVEPTNRFYFLGPYAETSSVSYALKVAKDRGFDGLGCSTEVCICAAHLCPRAKEQL